MTARDRLLAILKEPDRYSASPSLLMTSSIADMNARHRLKRLCEEIAKALDAEAKLISNSTHCGSENDELRAATQGWRTMHTARKFILAIGEPNEHS